MKTCGRGAPGWGWQAVLMLDCQGAPREPSARVRLALISAADQLPAAQRLDLLEPLARHMGDIADPMIPLLLWYRIEPLVSASASARERLLAQPCLPHWRGSLPDVWLELLKAIRGWYAPWVDLLAFILHN